MIELRYKTSEEAIDDGWDYLYPCRYKSCSFTGSIQVDISPHYWEFMSFFDSMFHSFDGRPAAHNGFDEYQWFRHGRLHREDGPAYLTNKTAEHRQGFYLDGLSLEFHVWLERIQADPAEKVLLRMQYG